MIIKVTKEDEGIRLDQFLSNELDDYSRSKISKIIKEGKVLVDGSYEKPKYIVSSGQEIELDINDLQIKPLEAQDLGLEIIYQDKYFAVINKPIGMLSHPTINIRENTLVNGLMHQFESLSDLYGPDRLGIVHRLDFNTCGLMIVCLTNEAHEKFKDLFETREIVKKYRAIVKGYLDEKEAVIDLPIARSLRNRKLMAVNNIGKPSKTGYKVLNENKGYSYLDLELFTGRTHQIRVHLSHINHPILGDKDYGGLDGKFSIDHQLLQSYYLEFNHPFTNERLKFKINESSEINKYKKVIFEE